MGFSLLFNLLQTVALMAAVLVASLAILKQRDIAKKDKTIELLMKDLEDDFLTEGLSILREVDGNNRIEDSAKEDKKNSNKAIAIRNLLNYYEIIGVGVQSDIYDLDMIKDAQKTMIVRIYEQSAPFIKRYRSQYNNNTLWKNFEQLVDSLKAN